MGFIILDDHLNQLRIVDDYESFIWTDRYYECGDFEMYTTVNKELLSMLIHNETMYVWSDQSDHIMVIENYEVKASHDDGSKIIITGRSAESIFDRRIVWGHVVFNKTPLLDAVEELINGNVINPANTNRKIDNIIFVRNNDPYINSLTITAEYSGDSLYDVLVEICREYGIGFKVYLTMSPELNREVFAVEFYSGDDHSYNQTKNPYVIFSPDFENLGNSNYSKTYEDYKNVVAFSGSSEAYPNSYIEYNPSGSKGLNRREMLASQSLANRSEENPEEVMASVGSKDLSDNKIEEMFEGQVDATNMFVYPIDFKIGDIVQIRNEYGIESVSRIIEIVMNQDQDTYEMYPTFETV